MDAAENIQLLWVIFKSNSKSPEIAPILSTIIYSSKKENLLKSRFEGNSLLHLVTAHDDKNLFNEFIARLKPAEIAELANTPNEDGKKPGDNDMCSENMQMLLRNACKEENKSIITNEQTSTTPICS